MNWFFVALIPPAIWGIANHIDKHVVTKYFKGRTAGASMIVTSMFGLVFITVIAIVDPSVFTISSDKAVLIMINGSLYLFGIIPYMYALQQDEASKVIPLFQFTPVFAYFLALIFLNQTLTAREIFASVLIIIGSFLISSDYSRKSFKIKKAALLLMALSSLLLSINAVLFRKFADGNIPFWTNSFWNYAGVAVAGLILMLGIRIYREAIISIIKSKSYASLGLISFSEGISLAARLIFYFATTLAPVALVQTVGGLQPFIVFIYGILITLFIPKLEPESLLRKHLAQKIISILIIFLGSYLLLKA